MLALFFFFFASLFTFFIRSVHWNSFTVNTHDFDEREIIAICGFYFLLSHHHLQFGVYLNVEKNRLTLRIVTHCSVLHMFTCEIIIIETQNCTWLQVKFVMCKEKKKNPRSKKKSVNKSTNDTYREKKWNVLPRK